MYCCFVSNGYMTLETLRLLKESGMDGLKIDLKGDAETYKKYCGGANVEKVWRNIREAKKLGLHIEVVNLVVTGVNDNEAYFRWLIERHLREAGAETPLHFTRYYPAYKFHSPPTEIETLEGAYDMAKKAGILYPYLGNVQGHKYENTYCPNCHELVVKRYSFEIVKWNLTKDMRCPACGHDIAIKGKFDPTGFSHPYALI